MASSDDEDLKRAIALSLQDEKPTNKTSKAGHPAGEVINLDSDDEEATTDDDETTDGESNSPLKQRNGPLSHKDRLVPTSIPTNTLAFLGIDRKKMEEERLARKRKVSISPPPSRKVAKKSANDPVELSSLGKQSSAETTSQIFASVLATSKVKTPFESQLLPATVKKTWAFGHPRTGDDIKIEEVLQKNDLNLAVLSSFQWEMDWLLTKLNLKNTQITLVMQAKDDATKQQYKRETAHMPTLRLCFPSMEGQVNCMHSKLMLLSHPTHLRVAVPTANLVSYDWGESGGIMENSIFLIDLPRLSNGRTAPKEITFFGRELIYFCEAMGLERSIINSIYNFDFAATKDLVFVHTIGGAHLGESWRRTGYCGLGSAVHELGLATEHPLKMDFITSSVGSLNINFLAMLYLAAQGDDGSTEYEWSNPTAGRSKAAKNSLQQKETVRKALEDDISSNFHIYFPTNETVRNSKAGSAGTICFQSKWYNSPTFPKAVLRDCKSILFVRRAYTNTAGSPASASSPWAYIGSANCSESAWGKLIKDRATKSPKLNCRNWECGVIVPVPQEGGKAALEGLNVFDETVPVPIRYPGESYGIRKPWYYSE